MELSFKELKKREVINVTDGQSFGCLVDITLDFPRGVLVGISVPAKRRGGIFSIFDRSTLYIEEKKILKIGSDVILVDINCGSVCGDSVSLNEKKPKIKSCDCPPPHPPKYPQPCPPQRPRECDRRDDFCEQIGALGQADGCDGDEY